MTINPKDAKPDQPFKVAVGGRRYTAQRVDPKDDSEQWRLLVPFPSNMSTWKDDEQVRIIAPLVPARNVTRDDLPSPEDVDGWGYRATDPRYPSRLLDAVVAHLNKNGGVPADPKLSVEGVEEARGRMSSVYPGWRHVPVSMPMNPTYGKCCEEAQLTAAELARRNEELAEAEGEIAAQRKRSTDELNVVQRNLNEYIERAEKAEAERDELQAKLDAAENRPTLDREAVRKVVGKHWVPGGGYYMDLLVNDLMALSLPERSTLDREAVESAIEGAWEMNGRGELDVFNEYAAADAIMALVPAAEGWPEWLGPRPEKPKAFRTPNNYWSAGGRLIDKDSTRELCDERIRSLVERASAVAAVRDAIESEQAATGDEDQRAEGQAKAMYYAGTGGWSLGVPWEEISSEHADRYRAAIRDGWTGPTKGEARATNTFGDSSRGQD